MEIQVEFEHGGRTYRVEPGVHEWNIYALNALREKVTFNTDLLTGEQLFISWSELGVVRRVKDDHR